MWTCHNLTNTLFDGPVLVKFGVTNSCSRNRVKTSWYWWLVQYLPVGLFNLLISKLEMFWMTYRLFKKMVLFAEWCRAIRSGLMVGKVLLKTQTNMLPAETTLSLHCCDWCLYRFLSIIFCLTALWYGSCCLEGFQSLTAILTMILSWFPVTEIWGCPRHGRPRDLCCDRRRLGYISATDACGPCQPGAKCGSRFCSLAIDVPVVFCKVTLKRDSMIKWSFVIHSFFNR